MRAEARCGGATLDAAATKAYGHAWNPLYQSGTVAVAMLLVLGLLRTPVLLTGGNGPR
jgi:hypothetical protein